MLIQKDNVSSRSFLTSPTTVKFVTGVCLVGNWQWAFIFVADGVEGDVSHVTRDVIIGVGGGLLMVALCVVAGVAFRCVYFARRKRFNDRRLQGSNSRFFN